MKQLTFPDQFSRYKKIDETFVYNKTDSSIVGLLEMLWTTTFRSEYDGLDRSKAKVLKSIFKKIKEITQWKDSGEDSRITKDGPQVLLLEENEYDLMKILIAANRLSVAAAEDLDLLWEVIESAQDYIPPKPILVQEPMNKD